MTHDLIESHVKAFGCSYPFSPEVFAEAESALDLCSAYDCLLLACICPDRDSLPDWVFSHIADWFGGVPLTHSEDPRVFLTNCLAASGLMKKN